jgi:DNA polymerase-3 subunit gamma/tau
MAFQSLYRRFRPQRFDEVIGQTHLVNALRNAVAEDRVGHAYLLSGPRGTGKTSTARILAKALNCEALGSDGEPCGECGSCVAVERGNSMDLVELDAASNNRVENIRELTANAALASPGRHKVYLLDEVHMLSTAASNALLKTLEEPPSHVVFILATTDPQKVLPTIRSRTQHVELNLVGAETLAEHVRSVADRAGIDVDDNVVDYVVTRGSGSVRDTLSALDQVVAAGGVPGDRVGVDDLLGAIARRDLTSCLGAVAGAVASGVDARDLAERTARRLRDMFLVAAEVDPGQLPAGEIAALGELATAMGRPLNVKALELVGTALVDMRQAPDPRLAFEVALVRLFADTEPTQSATAGGASAELLARIERLEAQLDTDPAGPPAASRQPAAELPGSVDLADAVAALGEAGPTAAPQGSPRSGPSAARAALAEARGENPAGTNRAPTNRSAPPSAGLSPPPAPVAPPPPPGAAPAPPPAPVVPPPASPVTEPPPAAEPPPVPSTEAAPPPPSADPAAELSHAMIEERWPDVLARLAPRARARFQAARFLRIEGERATFELPNEVHRDRCEQLRAEVEGVYSDLCGRPVGMLLVAAADPDSDGPGRSVPGGDPVPMPRASDETIDLDQLEDAPPDGRSTIERITDAFPGATVVDNDGSM